MKFYLPPALTHRKYFYLWLGLLISEAVSLFQWSRLTSILLVVIALVTLFDTASRRIRRALV